MTSTACSKPGSSGRCRSAPASRSRSAPTSGGERPPRRPFAGELAEDQRHPRAGLGQDGQGVVVLPPRRGTAVGVGQRHPQLHAVQQVRVRHRGVLGVRDARPGGHQSESARLHQLVAAETVAVVDRALEQPADRLQPDVRVRRHLHARCGRDIVRPVVVDEAPRPDQAPPEVRQQPAHLGGPAQRDRLALLHLVHRSRRGTHRPGESRHRRPAVQNAHAGVPAGSALRRARGRRSRRGCCRGSSWCRRRRCATR